MPTYSYKCTECGNAFDIQQAFSDASLTQCPSCGGKLRKVFGTVGVTFNGSGFYRTDSRATSGSTSASSDAKPGGAKKETTSDSSSSSGSTGSGASNGSSAAPAA